MWKHSLNRKKRAIVYAAITLLLPSAIFTALVSASPTTITIVPSTLTVGEEEGVPTDPFLINVTITSVEDLYSWQVTIFYDNTILNCTDVLFGEDNVFYGKTCFPLESLDTPGEIMCGSALLWGAETFTGSGLLCQLNLTGTGEGTSDLEISPSIKKTFLLDSTETDLEYTVESGEITVVPEFPAYLVAPLLVITTLTAIIVREILGSKRTKTSFIE